MTRSGWGRQWGNCHILAISCIFLQACGEHVGPILEEHSHILRGRGSVGTPPATAATQRDTDMAEGESDGSAAGDGLAVVVEMLQTFTEPFLQYAEDLHSQVRMGCDQSSAGM